MAYWVSVCEYPTNPGVRPPGPGVDALACTSSGGTPSALEVQLMVVPPAGSNFDGFWQLGAIGIPDALTISAAIAGLWAVAWGFRQLVRAISVGVEEADG